MNRPLPEGYHINTQRPGILEKPFVDELAREHSGLLENMLFYTDLKGRPVAKITQDNQIYFIKHDPSGAWLIESGNGIKTRAAKGYLPQVLITFTAWKKSKGRGKTKSKKTSPIV